MAAVMSTASAGLIASSTILANDVYGGFIARGEHDRVRVNRIATVLVGVATLLISVVVSDVVAALTVAYDLLTGALFVPIVGALFWRRATTMGALSSIVVSSVLVVVLLVTQGLLSNDPIIYGMLTSLLVFVVVSLLTPRPSAQLLDRWDRRLKVGPAQTDPEMASGGAATGGAAD
jgi:SSS family solute:Na+ symporter